VRIRGAIFWSIVTLGLAAAAFDWLARAHVRELQASAETLALHYAALTREIQAAGRHDSPAPASSARSAPPGTAAANPARAPADTPAPAGGTPIDPRRIIALNPELKAQYLQLLKDGLAADWNLLFHALNLPPEREEQLKQLMAQRNANSLDVAKAASDQGLDPNDKSMQKMRNQLNQQSDAAIAALLGPDYPSYQQYNYEHNVAPIIGDLAGNLPGAPLTLDQAEQLSHLLAASSQRDKFNWVVYGTIDLDQAMARAGAILAPEQLPVLKAVLQKNQSYVQSSRLAAPH
jgi:hypothetical protein